MKILIADDDPVSRRLLQGYLQRWGHEVVAACNGAEAWRMFQEYRFPLVISDWMMPEMDGVELVRRIRSCAQDGYVYTMLVTARSQKEDVVEGMEAGADDFVTKPFDRDELRVRLREGERIVRLEQTLAEQNRALREAQAALGQRQDGARLTERAGALAHEIDCRAAAIAVRLDDMRRELACGAGHDQAAAGPNTCPPGQEDRIAVDETLGSRLSRLLAESHSELARLRAAVRELEDLGRGD